MRTKKFLVTLSFIIEATDNFEIDHSYPVCLASEDPDNPVHVDICPTFVIDHESEPCATLDCEGVELIEVVEQDIRPWR